ncbi:MAG TPA: RtcB family protein [Candidatus Nanoarchaeia archaeon]|nr:RtcB family protein [Candidatus Nanoarchaeia archaeon]
MPIPPFMTKISPTEWEIPISHKKGMRVPARIIATEKLMADMDEGVINQVTNVATMPGIVGHAYCMPDGHWGYGFPIGGVAAFDLDEGVISPGGIGFDINCGMRLVTTNLTVDDVKGRIKELVDTLYKTVPAGVGSKGFLQLSRSEFINLVTEGSKYVINKGYGWEEDAGHTEASGCITDANAEQISEKAITRGINQIGTLGSGNHYLEIQRVDESLIHDKVIAKKWGIFKDQIVVMVHCGSRGFGHQVATDYLKIFLDAMPKYGITVPDRELACAPFSSPEGQKYFQAMACAANAAFANRQVILHRIREAFAKVFMTDAEKLDMHLLYDVAHNMAKLETHMVDGKKRKLIVHRKGATRSFGPGAEDLNPLFSETGQPVILGGSMETGSYLLAGTQVAMEKTFGSTAHGSGRTMSRTKAVGMVRGEKLLKDMGDRGIYVKAVSMSGLAEEAGFAYKDIHEVVKSIDEAGISKKIVGLLPIGNVKG